MTDECKRCGTQLFEGLCTDLTCPFSDHLQTCEAGWAGHYKHTGGACTCGVKVFEVPIVYRGQLNYLIKTTDKDKAEEFARARYGAGHEADNLGNEWEEIERVGEITNPG